MKTIILAGTLICLFATSAFGMGRHTEKDYGEKSYENRIEKMDTRYEKMKSKLDLSQTQETKLDAIHEKFKEEYSQIAKKMKPYKEKNKILKEQKKFNESEARSILEPLSSLKVDMHIAHMKHRQAVHDILTDEQLEKLHKKMKKHHKKHRGHTH